MLRSNMLVWHAVGRSLSEAMKSLINSCQINAWVTIINLAFLPGIPCNLLACLITRNVGEGMNTISPPISYKLYYFYVAPLRAHVSYLQLSRTITCSSVRYRVMKAFVNVVVLEDVTNTWGCPVAISSSQ